MQNLLTTDLKHIITQTRGLLDELRDARIFITGGTGFFGQWLLESFAFANRELELNATAVVLTRSPSAFLSKSLHLAQDSSIGLLQGDVRNFTFPEEDFSHVIHAATESSAKLNQENPLIMIDTIVEGTRRTLEFALKCNAKRFLLTSSGAIYGTQPAELTHIPETFSGGPDSVNPFWAYGESKRLAELLCSVYAKQYGLHTIIARCFTFVGPYLPLDMHFAIGNFIRDGLQGHSIYVNGDGTTYRSYLYSADLVIWLWTILLRGQSCRPYNVGSSVQVSIAELAQTVASVFDPTPQVKIAKQPQPDALPSRYVPDTKRIENELDLYQSISLPDAILRTVNWAKTSNLRINP